MELIITPSLDEHECLEEARFHELEAILGELDKHHAVTETNIGHGADWTVLLVMLGGIFLFGEKIQKNLDAWISLAKRAVGLLKRLSQNFRVVRVDASGAVALAIDDLLSRYSIITSLQLDNPQTVLFTPVPWNPSGRLDSQPDTMFLLTFRVNAEDVVIYGVKSKDTIEFRHTLKVFWGDF
jgi:hypothetical protein